MTQLHNSNVEVDCDATIATVVEHIIPIDSSAFFISPSIAAAKAKARRNLFGRGW